MKNEEKKTVYHLVYTREDQYFIIGIYLDINYAESDFERVKHKIDYYTDEDFETLEIREYKLNFLEAITLDYFTIKKFIP